MALRPVITQISDTRNTESNDSPLFRERDITIPRPPFGSKTEELLFAQVSGGVCVGHEVVVFSDSEHGGFRLGSLAPVSDEMRTALYAQCVLTADPSGDDRKIVAKWKADTMIDGWRTNALGFFELPNPDDFVSADLDQPGMPLGDGAVFEIRGRANMNNFRILGTEFGKMHYLHVAYYA